MACATRTTGSRAAGTALPTGCPRAVRPAGRNSNPGTGAGSRGRLRAESEAEVEEARARQAQGGRGCEAQEAAAAARGLQLPLRPFQNLCAVIGVRPLVAPFTLGARLGRACSHCWVEVGPHSIQRVQLEGKGMFDKFQFGTHCAVFYCDVSGWCLDWPRGFSCLTTHRVRGFPFWVWDVLHDFPVAGMLVSLGRTRGCPFLQRISRQKGWKGQGLVGVD